MLATPVNVPCSFKSCVTDKQVSHNPRNFTLMSFYIWFAFNLIPPWRLTTMKLFVKNWGGGTHTHWISKYLRWMALMDQDLRFSQLQCFRFKPTVMWRHVIRWVSSNVPDDRSTFTTTGTTCPMTEHHIPQYLNLWHQSYLNYAFLNENHWQWNPSSSSSSSSSLGPVANATEVPQP